MLDANKYNSKATLEPSSTRLSRVDEISIKFPLSSILLIWHNLEHH
jgi:hypothetical protein